jgi:TMEM175 potassium channel family protein
VSGRWDTGRTEAFSDGVFAIAITLLVLDIRVPEADFDHLWHGIAHQWPAYLAYLTSFMTIGGVWLAHHAMFGRLRYVDATLMRINLLVLLAASFLPFPTRLMAEAIRNTDAERAAVIVYGGSLLVISLLLAAMWRAIAERPQLLRPEVSEREVDAILRATAPNIGFYVLVTLLAIVAPHVAAFGYLLGSIAVVLRARGDERPAAGPDAQGP